MAPAPSMRERAAAAPQEGPRERGRGGGGAEGAVAGRCLWGGCGEWALGRLLPADPERRVRCPPVEAQGFAPPATHPPVPGDTCPSRSPCHGPGGPVARA
ncbi:uncharacterized protein LOC127059596 [Serinus canaria]|uniref:uncharacterized protein LOC127059596 n=1 Tax=Serinus canaria TaxID=9135 RepID=UPI0021CC684B|nr:uncharacterized protein LOC127059596 [Serinus canaria]